jgi:putative tryptophan/tyrosine transport system substrate-binding protein
MSDLRRREFISLISGAVAAWPRGLMAQPATRVYRIGVLVPFPAGVLASFFDALRQLGFVEGQNLTIDGRGFAASMNEHDPEARSYRYSYTALTSPHATRIRKCLAPAAVAQRPSRAPLELHQSCAASAFPQ